MRAGVAKWIFCAFTPEAHDLVFTWKNKGSVWAFWPASPFPLAKRIAEAKCYTAILWLLLQIWWGWQKERRGRAGVKRQRSSAHNIRVYCSAVYYSAYFGSLLLLLDRAQLIVRCLPVIRPTYRQPLFLYYTIIMPHASLSTKWQFHDLLSIDAKELIK